MRISFKAKDMKELIDSLPFHTYIYEIELIKMMNDISILPLASISITFYREVRRIAQNRLDWRYVGNTRQYVRILKGNGQKNINKKYVDFVDI